MPYFLLHIFFRTVAIFLLSLGLAYASLTMPSTVILLFACALAYAVYGFYHYGVQTNRKITRFFESIQYDDYNIKFQMDSRKGKSFEKLNSQLNLLLQAFRQARAEKEATLHYLNGIVQNIQVGILSIDQKGDITLINQTAFRLLGVYRLKHISELEENHLTLYQKLQNLNLEDSILYESAPDKQLVIRKTTLNLRGQELTLISIQNILDELQEKELEAWQNLTKILRHEIMNSISPIVSLIATMKDILQYDIQEKSPATEDLSEALQTIESRGRGVMNFVNAYREFTNIPKPKLQEIAVSKWIERVGKLFEIQAKQENVQFSITIEKDFMLVIDLEQLDQVLINLLKNAFEATENNPQEQARQVSLKANLQQEKRTIAIQDNGTGIDSEAIEKIFMPFYSTKPKGSGIGLSLSYQIVRLHQAHLKVTSELGRGSTFFIYF